MGTTPELDQGITLAACTTEQWKSRTDAKVWFPDISKFNKHVMLVLNATIRLCVLYTHADW